MKPGGASWLLLLAPLAIALLSVPMALDLVEPNGIYGVRTEATRASEAAWYRANRAAGAVGTLAGLVATGAMVAAFRSAMPVGRKHMVGVALVVALAVAIVLAGTAAA